MKRMLLISLFLSATCLAQKPPTSSGGATTKGECSPAVTGNNNNFKFSCGVGQEQAKQIIALLNQLLASNNTSEVIAKLNELLKRTNPNQTVKTYQCDGQWMNVGPAPGVGSMMEMGGLEDIVPVFNEMLRLNNARQYPQLLKESLAQIDSKPEWLTPLLFAGLAYTGMGDLQKAKSMLSEFDSKTGAAYDDGACKEMSTFLHNKLN
jgi:hypothetical protein